MSYLFLCPNKKLLIDNSILEIDVNLHNSFLLGTGHGLLHLERLSQSIDEESLIYWRDFTRLYLSVFLTRNDHSSSIEDVVEIDLPKEDILYFLQKIPPVKGVDYIDEESLILVWGQIERDLFTEIKEYGKNIEEFLIKYHPNWSMFGKVCFHLAENKNSDIPFAFLATYLHKVIDGRAKYLPLSIAINEYEGNNNLLLKLLSPLYRASANSVFLKEHIDSGDIYHPLAWSPKEAHQFLKDIPIFENAGIIVKIPNWWSPTKPNIPKIKARIGEDKPHEMGFEALLSCDLSLTIGEEVISEDDIRELLLKSDSLVFFKGKWVEVDKAKLEDLLKKWNKINKQMRDEGVSFAQGLRWLSGVDFFDGNVKDNNISSSMQFHAGSWICSTLASLKDPEQNKRIDQILERNLQATLRPYQVKGVQWLHLLNYLQLGAILADDMGLGKTLQVISLLLIKKNNKIDKSNGNEPNQNHPSLLIVPASLIGNWKEEMYKFAPSLQYTVVHSSENANNDKKKYDKDHNYALDLVITTYALVSRLSWLSDKKWDLIILDEAQSIKNPDAKQTKAIKNLSANHRLAITGTPVENRLADLWSIFDFISPGLLGTYKEFAKFTKNKSQDGHSPYPAIRSLVTPYILRRMKTDKKIISDLPDKTEIKSYCFLTKKQKILYQDTVASLKKELENLDNKKRQGIIFSYLIRFKQICNHPSHWLKDDIYLDEDSGKFIKLKEICEIISQKQEKLLIFTQFQEMTLPLFKFLTKIFGKEGLILHGGTQIKDRPGLVKSFQKDDGPPFFVLSLKAGGSGLNLTNASC